MRIALGRSKESEYKENLHLLTEVATGSRGLFFTNNDSDEILQYFREFNELHYARSGFVSTITYGIPSGPLVQFPFNMEPKLRQLGLPTSLKQGVIHLESKVTVCQEGDVLTPEQCKILELFDQKLAEMRIHVHCHYWNNGQFERFEDPEGDISGGRGAEEDGEVKEGVSDMKLLPGESIEYVDNDSNMNIADDDEKSLTKNKKNRRKRKNQQDDKQNNEDGDQNMGIFDDSEIKVKSKPKKKRRTLGKSTNTQKSASRKANQAQKKAIDEGKGANAHKRSKKR